MCAASISHLDSRLQGVGWCRAAGGVQQAAGVGSLKGLACAGGGLRRVIAGQDKRKCARAPGVGLPQCSQSHYSELPSGSSLVRYISFRHCSMTASALFVVLIIMIMKLIYQLLVMFLFL